MHCQLILGGIVLQTRFRAHPLTILANFRRVLFLILIPALRGAFSALWGGGLLAWLRGAWMDALVLAAMTVYAVWQWRRVELSSGGGILRLKSGLIMRREVAARWEHITTAAVIAKFYLRPFGAVHFRADTLGGGPRSGDFALLLAKRDAQILLDSHSAACREGSAAYRPGTSSILALSLLTSNSPGGIIFLATLVSQSGKLLGEEFSQRVIGTFESLARTLAFGVPPAAAAIGWLLLLGWLAGFLLTFLRYKDYELTRTNNTIRIISGKFTGREYIVRAPDINFIDIRQSIATKLLRMYSLYLSAAGYGKHKDDISCVIPTEKAAQFARHRERLFPGMSPGPAAIRPNRTGLMRFLSDPLACITAVLAALAAALWLFPGWRPFCLFVGLMLLAPALFFLFVRILDYRSGGFSSDENNYTMRYSRALYLHTVVVPRDKITAMELRQSFFQRRGSNCDLYLFTNAEGKAPHRARSLNKRELSAILGLSTK